MAQTVQQALDEMKGKGYSVSSNVLPSDRVGVREVAKEVPKSTGTVLRWVGKQLMKPIGVVATATEQIGKAIGGEGISAIKQIPQKSGQIITGNAERSFTDIWRENLIPLLQEKPSTSVVKNIVPELAATTIGTIFDIAADPLNFIGGITTKGLALAEKGVSKISLFKGLKPVFSTKVGIKEVDTLIDEYKSLGEFRKANVIEEARDIQKAVSKLPKEDIINVSNYIEKGTKATPEINALGERLKKTYADYKSLEKSLGVKGAEIAQYAPHIKVKTPVAETIKNMVFPSKVWSAKLGGAEKGRSILKFVSESGEEFIGKAENFGLKETKNGFMSKTGKLYKAEQASIDEVAQAFNKKFFEENPAIQLAYRGMASAKAVTGKEFFNSIKKFATKEGVDVVAPELKGMKFSPEIAAQVDNYYKGIQPEELKVVAKTFDAVQNWWKGQALIAPSYHIRNMVGNIWNNFLAGVKNPVSYIQAGLLQSGKGKELRIAGMTGDELIELMKKRGVINQGWFASDIPTMVEGGIKNTWKQGVNPLSQQNYGFKLNQKVGSAFENNARIAHFIEKLKGGSSVDDAVMSVKKYLFNYQDLTNFERTVLKRIFPFYTWTRKNIPLQLENLLTQPGKYAGLEKVVRGIEKMSMGDNKPANEKYLSNYIKNNTAMRVGYNKDTKTYNYFLLGQWMPSYQALDFLSEPMYNIMSMVTPLIKTPIELMANQSSFFRNTLGEREMIENYPGETTNYLGLSMPKKTAVILRNIRLLNELDKLNPGKIFGGKKGEPSIFNGLPAVKTPMGVISPSQYKYGPTAIQPTVKERVTTLFVGKLQQYKESVGREQYQRETDERVSQIKSAIKSASKKGDTARIKTLNQILKDFLKQRGR